MTHRILLYLMQTKTGEHQIYMHNNLVRHTMDTMLGLDVMDLRLVAYLIDIGIPNPKKPEMPRRIRGSVSGLAAHCGITGGDIYKSVRQSTESLMTKLIRFKRPSDGARVSTTWIAEGVYHEGDGWFEVQFSDSMQGLLTDLSKQWTKFRLDTMLELGASQYAVRLYQVAKSFESLGTWKTPIADLRAQLGVPDTGYKRLSDFRKIVLDYPIRIINERSDISLEYAKGNLGRKWTDLVFHVKPQPKPKPCKAPEGFDSLDKSERDALWQFAMEKNLLYPDERGWKDVTPAQREKLYRYWIESKQQPDLFEDQVLP